MAKRRVGARGKGGLERPCPLEGESADLVGVDS